jgi:hypothetical protein
MSKHLYIACAVVLSALTLSAQTTTTSTSTLPVVATTAMIGLAQGETAQFNLLNPGVEAPAVGVICTATVTYFDAGGAQLKTATVSVAPGLSSAVDLSGDTDLAIAAGQRREIRVEVAKPAPGCRLIPTLEIFDTATGRTLVSLGRLREIRSVVATPAHGKGHSDN